MYAWWGSSFSELGCTYAVHALYFNFNFEDKYKWIYPSGFKLW
jgi:hypothetical protein